MFSAIISFETLGCQGIAGNNITRNKIISPKILNHDYHHFSSAFFVLARQQHENEIKSVDNQYLEIGWVLFNIV
jgi:hypothetical protein